MKIIIFNYFLVIIQYKLTALSIRHDYWRAENLMIMVIVGWVLVIYAKVLIPFADSNASCQALWEWMERVSHWVSKRNVVKGSVKLCFILKIFRYCNESL